jgi:hypothetical protein
MGGAGGAVQTQQQFKNGGAQTQADASQKTDDTGSSPSADQSSSTTTRRSAFHSAAERGAVAEAHPQCDEPPARAARPPDNAGGLRPGAVGGAGAGTEAGKPEGAAE